MTYQLTVTLPKETGHRIQKIAVERNVRPEKVVADLIDERIDAYPVVHTANDQEPVLHEMLAFDGMKPHLLVHYSGQYVAITDGKLIDSDAHRRTLIRRIRPQYPDQFVLVRLVEEGERSDLHFRGWSFG